MSIDYPVRKQTASYPRLKSEFSRQYVAAIPVDIEKEKKKALEVKKEKDLYECELKIRQCQTTLSGADINNKAQVKMLQDQINALQADNARISNLKGGFSSTEKTRLEASITNLESEKADLQTENARLSRLNGGLSATEKTRLEADIEHLNNANTALILSNANLTSEKERCEKDLAEYKTQKPADVAEINRLKDKILSTETNHNAAIDVLKKDLEKSKAACTASQATTNKTQKKAIEDLQKTYDSQIKELRQKLNVADNSNTALNTQIKSLENEKEKLNKLNEEKLAEISTLNAKNLKSEQDKTDLQTRFDSAQTDLSNQNTVLTDANKVLHNQIDDLRLDHQAALTKNNDEKAAELKSQKEVYEIQLQEQEKQIETLNSDHQAALLNKDTKNQELQSRLEKIYDEKLKNLNTEYKNRLKELQETNVKLDAENQALRKEIDRIVLEHSSNTGDASNRIKTLETELDENKKKLNDLNDEFRTYKLNYKDVLEGKKKSEGENASLKNENDSLKNSNSQLNGILNEQKNKFEIQNKQMELEIKNNNKRISELEEKLLTANNSIEQFEKKITELQNEKNLNNLLIANNNPLYGTEEQSESSIGKPTSNNKGTTPLLQTGPKSPDKNSKQKQIPNSKINNNIKNVIINASLNSHNVGNVGK